MGAQLGLHLIGAGGSPAFLGHLDDGRVLLIVDAHERNLVYSAPDLGGDELLDETTPAFLIDATARILSDAEAAIVTPLIGCHCEPLFPDE